MNIDEIVTNASNMTFDTYAAEFVRMAQTRELHVGILGMGYVGLPLAQALIRQGFRVTGFDTDESKCTALAAGKSYIKHIQDPQIATMNATGRFGTTTNFDRLAEPDAILICVPTPLDRYREPDLSFVRKSTEAISTRLRRGQIVILESTTWPGTSNEVMRPILEKGSGLKGGVDFAIAYSPEREDPGNQHFETADIPKVVGADSKPELDMAVALYEQIVPKTVPVKDLGTAEAVKLTENIFRFVNIALVNELKLVFDEMGIDVWEVINAASTKPFGFMPFYPGPGLGGHCIPIDPFYLTWKARAFNQPTRFIELAGDITRAMPRHVVTRFAETLNTRLSKSLRGSKVLLLGIAYKKNIDDMRESPAMEVWRHLKSQGAEVDYYDPLVSRVPHLHEYPEFDGVESVEFSRKTLEKYDAALITTDHDIVNYRLLCESLPLVVDTRNAAIDMAAEFGHKIVKV